MRIEKLLAILALGALVSCQTKDNLNPMMPDPDPSEEETAIVQEEVIQTDDPVAYLAQLDFDKWTSLQTIEERIAACNPPQDQLKKMSTKALVESVIDYPLNYLIFAYNDPMDAIQFLADQSNILQELEQRKDAAKCLIQRFSKNQIDRSLKRKSNLKENKVTYFGELFLEYYMASGRIPDLISEENEADLKDAIYDKMQEREKQSEGNYDLSLASIQKMSASPALRWRVANITRPPRISTSRIYSQLGTFMDTDIYAEFSAQDISDLTQFYHEEYPNATVVAPASSRYNCHSYAWYNQSTTANHHWINPMSSDGKRFQLSAYWTAGKGIYVSCAESQAELVYYANVDGGHSAVKRPDGKYISKWGCAPVMIHDPAYCPYTASGRQFYKVSPYLPLGALKVNGPDSSTMLTVGQNYNYYVDTYNPSVTYQWTVESYPGDSNFIEPTILSDRMTYSSLSIRFNAPGYYVMRVDTYGTTSSHQAIHIAYGIKSAVAIPQL